MTNTQRAATGYIEYAGVGLGMVDGNPQVDVSFTVYDSDMRQTHQSNGTWDGATAVQEAANDLRGIFPITPGGVVYDEESEYEVGPTQFFETRGLRHKPVAFNIEIVDGYEVVDPTTIRLI